MFTPRMCARVCVCIRNSSRYSRRYRICAASASSGGVRYLFKNNLVPRQRGEARLLYLPSSCLISRYHVPRCRTSLARAPTDFSPGDFSRFLSHSRFSSVLSLSYLRPLTAAPRSRTSPERDYYFRLKCRSPPRPLRFCPSTASGSDRVEGDIVKSIPKSSPPLCFPESSDRPRGKSNFSFDQNSFQSRADLALSEHECEYNPPP